MLEPLDRGLNEAILEVATELLPDGFDVSKHAPDIYAKLKAHLDAGHRLVVFEGGSARTIYVDPRVNHAFRAWHDHTHWKGGFDFSVEGEIATCRMQCEYLRQRYGDTERTRQWCKILDAEIIGQRLFYHRHKRYIEDQRGFVEAYLHDPELALLWSLW